MRAGNREGQACFSIPLGNNLPIACSLAMSSFRKHCTFQEEGLSFQVEKMKARNWMFIQTSCSVQVFEGRKAKEGRVDWEKHHWLAGGYRLLHYHNEVSEDLCSPQLLPPAVLHLDLCGGHSCDSITHVLQLIISWKENDLQEDCASPLMPATLFPTYSFALRSSASSIPPTQKEQSLMFPGKEGSGC